MSDLPFRIGKLEGGVVALLTRLGKSNTCHVPSGPGGGQFCETKGGVGGATASGVSTGSGLASMVKLKGDKVEGAALLAAVEKHAPELAAAVVAQGIPFSLNVTKSYTASKHASGVAGNYTEYNKEISVATKVPPLSMDDTGNAPYRLGYRPSYSRNQRNESLCDVLCPIHARISQPIAPGATLPNRDNTSLGRKLIQGMVDPVSRPTRLPKSVQDFRSSDAIIAAEMALSQKNSQDCFLDGLRVNREGDYPTLCTHDLFQRQIVAGGTDADIRFLLRFSGFSSQLLRIWLLLNTSGGDKIPESGKLRLYDICGAFSLKLVFPDFDFQPIFSHIYSKAAGTPLWYHKIRHSQHQKHRNMHHGQRPSDFA
jgi:hypothetical protein